MNDLKKYISLNKNKVSNDINMPQYTISYKAKATNTKVGSLSYRIISALKEDSDIVLEVNSSLFSLPQADRESFALIFLSAVRNIDLDYSYRKTSSPSKSFFSQLFGKKEECSHEILVYIPDEVWKKEDFFNIIPKYGVRYYITKDNTDGKKVIEDMNKMLDEEKIEKFKFLIFDVAIFNQMGVISKSHSAESIKQLLGI